MAEYATAGRFNSGEPAPQPIETDGTYLKPYTISDALQVCNSSTTWGYARGRVRSVESINGTYLQNLVIEDLNDNTKTMSIYKLHQHDDDSVYGFKSVDDLAVGDEVLFYGGFKNYDSGPGFGSVTVLIALNDSLASGNSADNPTSIVNFIQSIVFNLATEMYVFGTVTATNVDGSTFQGFTLSGNHNIDYGPGNMESYDTELVFTSPFTYTYAAGLSYEDVSIGAKVVCRVDLSNLIVHFVTVSSIEHAGTLDDPYSVHDALIAAAKYTNSSDSPQIYCTGVVSRLGTAIGASGDIKNLYIQDPNTGEEILIYYLQKDIDTTIDFTNVNEIPVGTRLLICGRPFKYNSTLEFASGTYCVEIVLPA